MPQFDKITFLNQIIWLFFFFSSTYIIMLKFFLPKIAFLLKLREKKLFKGFKVIEFCPIEIKNLQKSSNLFWFNLINEVKDVHILFQNLFNSWILKQSSFINFFFVEKKVFFFRYVQFLIHSISDYVSFKKEFTFEFNFLKLIQLTNFEKNNKN